MRLSEGSGLRRDSKLVVRLLHIRVIEVLLLFLKSMCGGKLLRGWLLARGKKRLQCSTRHRGVLHQSVRHDVIRMPNHAGGVVGEISDIAVLDEDSFAVANVGKTGGEVLRGGEGSGENAEQYDDAQLQEKIAFVSVDRRDESHMIPLCLRSAATSPGEVPSSPRVPGRDHIVERGGEKEQAAS